MSAVTEQTTETSSPVKGQNMKKIVSMIAAVAVASVMSVSAKEGEAKTLKGEGLCAKCELKETSKCQNAIRVEEKGKKVVYYFADNEVSKNFHKKVCGGPAKVVAHGKITEKEGKKWIEVDKVEEAK